MNEIISIHKNRNHGYLLVGKLMGGGQYHSDFGLLFDIISVYDLKYGLNLKML